MGKALAASRSAIHGHETKPRRRAARLAEDDPTGWKAIDRLIGSARSGISDISEKHDDYLYGDPRD